MKSAALAFVLLSWTAPLLAARHPAAPSHTAVVVPAGPDAFDRIVEPTRRVGAITHTSTEEEIVRVYGSTNVTPGTAGAYIVLFLGKPDEIRVDFSEPHRFPERVSIGGAGGAWQTANGLRVGLTVQQLEDLNGGPFDVTGLNYEIPARVVSWRGGTFPPTLFVDLAPSDALGNQDQKRLSSNKTFFDSSNPALRTFLVHRIVVEW